MKRPPIIWLIVAVLAFSVTNNAWAEGRSFVLGGHDLTITVDSRWTGNANGGYYPIRLRVVNRGPTRVLTFHFESRSNERMPRVHRTLNVQQNATMQFTLSIPMVSGGSGGRLAVRHNGAILPGMQQQINLPESDYSGNSRPSLLLISPNNLDCDRFEEASTSLSSGSATSHSGYYGVATTEDHEVVDPSMLPDSWIDYSGLDIVALSLETLKKLALTNRSAILQWVQTGGTLIVYDVAESAQTSSMLNELLEFQNPFPCPKLY